ncbi:MAG: putative O-succinylbenzoate-CoA ligase [Ramlibacter sp.]|nr:putative O-succinylbenzoate-CoA ligase [Ramlibacter sp.]
MSLELTVNGARMEWETIGQLLDERARDQRDQFAIEICGRRMTYGELVGLADRVAANLHGLGIRKGDHVASMLPNSLEQILTWFGAVKIGAVWFPVNTGLIGDDLAYTLRDAAPKALVVASDYVARVEATGADVPGLRFTVGEARPAYASFEQLLSGTAAPPAVEIGPADPAVVVYTGGTTGLPKGVILPHFAWIAATYRYRETFDIRPGDRHYSVLSLFHNGGLQLGVLGPIMCGIPTTVDAKFSLSNYWRRIRETKSTVIDMIGTIMLLLAQAPENPDEKDNSVRVCLAPILQLPEHIPPLFAERFGIELINVYSLSEGGGTVIIHGKPNSSKPLSNGNGCGWADLQIVDERDLPLPPGAVGQICLRPRVPHIFMAGYLNNEKKTVETFRNLWLHTGDLGHLDEDGDLYFTGRQVHWMRRRGENVSAYEIEALVRQYPGVKDVVAVGVPSDVGEEEIKAFVIAEPDYAIHPAALAQWCRTRIAAFKVPRYIEFVADFPRSTTKLEIERHKLKALSNERAWDSTRDTDTWRHP